MYIISKQNFIWIIILCSYVIVGTLFLSVDNFLKAVFVITLLIFCGLCLIKFSSTFFFYLYIALLFYIPYLKLLFPFLPIGIIPDIVFVLFIFRAFLFDFDKVKQTIFKKTFLIPNILLLVYLLLNFVGMFNPILPNILIGVQSFRIIYKIIAVYWGTLFVLNSKDQIFTFLRFLRINIFIVFLFSFKQILFGFSDYELTVPCPGHIRRIYSFATNPAVFSVILGIGSLDLYLKSIFQKRIFYLFLCFCYLLVSSLTLHRAPLFATFISLGLISLLNLNEIGRFSMAKMHKVIFFILIIFLVVPLLFIISLPPKYSEMRAEIVERYARASEGFDKTPSIEVRIKQIPPVIRALKQYPFGAGLGYTQLRFGKRYDDMSFFKGLQNTSFTIRLPTGTGDSTFLSILLEMGWFGLGYFLSLLIWILFSTGIKSWMIRNNPEVKYIISLSFGIMILIALSIITSSIYFSLIVGSMFWISFAISKVIWQKNL